MSRMTTLMQKLISQTSQSCYVDYQLRRRPDLTVAVDLASEANHLSVCQLRHITSVRKCLTTEAAAKLVTLLVLSRLDYCKV